jgi:hypothetical protein
VSDREHAKRFQRVVAEASPLSGQFFETGEVKPAAGIPRKPFEINEMIPDGH